MSRGSLLRKDHYRFGIYLGTNVINKAIPFLLLPILTRYLPPSDYGLFSVYHVLSLFGLSVIGMNMGTLVTRSFYEEEKEALAELVGNILGVLSCNFVVVGLALTLAAGVAGSILGIPGFWIPCLALFAAGQTVFLIRQVVLRNQKRAVAFGTNSILRTITELSISIALVVGVGLGWEGRAAGLLAGGVGMGAIALVQLHKGAWVNWDVDRKRMRRVVVLAAPLIAHTAGGVVIALCDRLLIEIMVGHEAVGIYTVGYQFGMIVSLLAASFNQVWSPWLYEQLADITAPKKRKIVRYTYLYDVGIFVVAVLVWLTSLPLIRWVTTAPYFGAREFVPWVALGYAAHGMYTMVFPYLIHVGRMKLIAAITTAGAALNLVANVVLIRMNGPVGAAQATLITYVLIFLGVWWWASRLYSMPWLTPLSGRDGTGPR